MDLVAASLRRNSRACSFCIIIAFLLYSLPRDLLLGGREALVATPAETNTPPALSPPAPPPPPPPLPPPPRICPKGTRAVTKKAFLHEHDCSVLQNWTWNVNKDISWTGKNDCECMPRVLVYTWTTENTFYMFRSDLYWKMCYAHIHGFDLVLIDGGNGASASWSYNDDLVWGWFQPIQKYLDQDYDYVFFTGGDYLITERQSKFPIWAWNLGHDLTVMDQPWDQFGFNENALLWRVSGDRSWIHHFHDVLYEYRHGTYLQGDNGPYMETILRVLGEELEAEGKPGYDGKCRHQGLVLDMPASQLFKQDFARYRKLNLDFSRCFFTTLEAMIGPGDQRRSKRIGFSSLYDPKMPWANCWLSMRNLPKWQEMCFGMHWTGLNKPDHHQVQGKCPDPTFEAIWAASPHNRMKQSS